MYFDDNATPDPGAIEPANCNGYGVDPFGADDGTGQVAPNPNRSIPPTLDPTNPYGVGHGQQMMDPTQQSPASDVPDPPSPSIQATPGHPSIVAREDGGTQSRSYRTIFCLILISTLTSATLVHASDARSEAETETLRDDAGTQKGDIDRIEHAVMECSTEIAARPPSRLLIKIRHTVCFVGIFNLGVEDEIIPLLDDGGVLIIKSAGGNGVAAARLGTSLLDKKIDVGVIDYCLSACANWVFLAGRYKYISDGAFVGWHGVPQKPDPRAKLLDHAGMLTLFYELSNQVFERAAIDTRLARDPDKGSDEYLQWSAKVKPNSMSYWTWNPITLRQRFKVGGIVYAWYPSDRRGLMERAEKLGLNFLVPP